MNYSSHPEIFYRLEQTLKYVENYVYGINKGNRELIQRDEKQKTDPRVK